MLNFEHIVCEFADHKSITYGKAERLIMVKLKILARKHKTNLRDVLNKIEAMDNDQLAECCDLTMNGQAIILEKSIDTPVDKDCDGSKQPNNGGPTMTKPATKERLDAKKAAPEKKAAPKKKAAGADTDVTVKALCEELDINAKAARAKLRRLDKKGKVPETREGARWVWDVKHRDTLLALLK